jgi:hypothetical protein
MDSIPMHETYPVQVEGHSSGNVSHDSINVAIYGGFFCAIIEPACSRYLYGHVISLFEWLAYRYL